MPHTAYTGLLHTDEAVWGRPVLGQIMTYLWGKRRIDDEGKGWGLIFGILFVWKYEIKIVTLQSL